MADSSVLFTNNTSGSPDSYAWDFGDGGSSVIANPTHTYTASGIYVVRLTAVKGGVSSTIAKVVPIQSAGTSLTLLATHKGDVLSTNAGDLLAAVV